ncbi:MFS transporter, partial [Rhodococcus sp. WS4]
MRSIGTSTASAVAAVLLAQNVVAVGGHEYTTATGLRLAFAAAGLAALGALAIAWFLPRRERVYPDASVAVT